MYISEVRKCTRLLTPVKTNCATVWQVLASMMMMMMMMITMMMIDDDNDDDEDDDKINNR